MPSNPTQASQIGAHVLRSTISNAVWKLLFLISGFLLTPFILRHLGATQFGLWALVGSVVAYGTLLDLGIGGAIVKFVAEFTVNRRWDELGGLLTTALYLYSFAGLIVILLSVAVAPVFPRLFHVPADQRSTAIWLMILMGIGTGIAIPSAITSAIIRGLQRYDVVSFLSTIGLSLYVAGTVLVLSAGGGVLHLVVVTILANVLTQVPSFYFIKHLAPELHLSYAGWARPWVGKILAFSSWLFVLEFFGRIQTRSDEVVIGAFLPVSAITPFTLARRLGEVGQMVTDQFLKVLMPLASQLDAKNDTTYLRALYITGTRVTIAILLPVFLLLFLLARPLLALWVGAAYAPYAHLVVILGLATLIQTSAWPAGSILQGTARNRPLAISSACAAAANVALSVGLVRRFGLTGVALGTLIPTAVASFGYFLPYTTKIMGIRGGTFLREALFPPLLPVVPMVVIMYVLHKMVPITSFISILLVSAVAGGTYVIGYLTWGASNAELQTYRALLVNARRYAEDRIWR
jgi:O-antigen/teichoic acid export membrane protein